MKLNYFVVYITSLLIVHLNYSPYFIIRGEGAVDFLTARFNCTHMTPSPPPAEPVLSNGKKVWRSIYLEETMELIEKAWLRWQTGGVAKVLHPLL